MPVTCRFGALAQFLICLASWVFLSSIVEAGQYLVADRLLGRVLRYSSYGSYLGTLINDPTLGVGPTAGGISGITLSPSQSRLYVSDRTGNRIAVFSYNGTSA